MEEYTRYYFDYRTLPDISGEVGTGTIEFLAADRTGLPDDNDALCIKIDTGPYAGYENCGELGGGNLKISDK